jgi:hypothetical protein
MFRAAPKLEIAFLSSSLISDRRDASPVKKRKKRKKKKKRKRKRKKERYYKFLFHLATNITISLRAGLISSLADERAKNISAAKRPLENRPDRDY